MDPEFGPMEMAFRFWFWFPEIKPIATEFAACAVCPAPLPIAIEAVPWELFPEF